MPPGLWQRMRAPESAVLRLDVPRAARVATLVREYGVYPPAQLAECAVDPAAANAELLFVPRAGKRVPWPALVQTRAIAPGEPLRWVYNSNPTTPNGPPDPPVAASGGGAPGALRASAEAARRQRRTDLNRDIRGRFKKDGRLKCV